MNSSFSLSTDTELDVVRTQHPYFNWVCANFPLLTSENLEQEYARQMLKLIVDSQTKPVPEDADSRIAIRVDCQTNIYQDLRVQSLEQFARLCASAAVNDEFGVEAREFLSYLVLCDGYPAYRNQRQELANLGALVLRQLMDVEDFRPDIHSTVSGVVGYSEHARVSTRLIMLEAFSEYFSAQTRVRPGRRELSGILFDGLNLELRRPKSNQSTEFQMRLIKLLVEHPHPATKVVLSVVAAEHGDESLRKRARESLRQLDDSLSDCWEATTPDQVSGVEFRARCLSEIVGVPLPEPERVQMIYNACKGLKIVRLSDPRLAQLRALLLNKSKIISLASAIALSNIYELDPACEVAGKAIEVLTDWAINGEQGRYVLDALGAVKKFELMSDSCAKKVQVGYIVANQKFIFQNGLV